MQTTQLSWQTEQRTVDTLLPHKKTPRKISKEQADRLKQSLETYGLVEIPAIDLDGTILAGHQRIKVLQLLGRGKYFWNDKSIQKRPVLGFTASELGYVFFGSIVIKTLISYILSDFLVDILSIRIVEWLVVALALLSMGALIVLLSKLFLKLIPR